jgi:hypothetical protein
MIRSMTKQLRTAAGGEARQKYEDKGYADMAASGSFRISECPYFEGWQRDAWQAGAWRWMEEQRNHASVHHATKTSPAQLQREIDKVLAHPGKYSYEEAMDALEKKHSGVPRGGSLRSGHAPVAPKMPARNR